LALGAGLGVAMGATIGAVSGDVGPWVAMGPSIGGGIGLSFGIILAIRRRQARGGRLQCGYSLKGLRSKVCPERGVDLPGRSGAG